MLLLGLLLLIILMPGCRRSASSGEGGDPFALLMNVGKNYYDKGDAQRAIEPFRKATELSPTQFDAWLNLANAYLLAGDATNALQQAQQAVILDPNSAAAHYVAGCAYARLRQLELALKAFQTSRDLEPTVGAATYQLARTHQELGHLDDAIALYQELTGFETNHPIAFYALSQALIRAGRTAEANAAVERHREIIAAKPGATMNTAKMERCVHTQARAPFIAEQPDAAGIKVVFTDVTPASLPEAANYRGPIGFIDFNHDGRNGLFVGDGSGGFRLLENTAGKFQPRGAALPGIAGAQYRRCLIADLQNDRFDDVLVIGD